MKRYYTVVFEITDEDAWKGMGPAFTQSLVEGEEQDSPVPGVRVVSCGEGDVMTGFDALDEFARGHGEFADDLILDWADNNDVSREEAKLIIG